ncbi:MAG: nucleoside-diphosphate sugar epimerase/dehydratase [Parvibaculaceae bacterium]|nr:nucleoside-diphosphate sugar epimerase/dehydratase [Parvibaculaceae bacterium]
MQFIDKYRNYLIFAADLLIAAISFPLSIMLRLGSQNLPILTDPIIFWTGVFTAISFAVLLRARLSRIAWRYVSTDDAMLIVRTSLVINLGFLLLMFLWTRLDGLPRSAPIINIFVLTALLITPRLAFRMLHERRIGLTAHHALSIPVLLIGGTDEADAFIRAAARSDEIEYRVIGIVDTGERPVGNRIRGVPVIGRLSDIRDLLTRLRGKHQRPAKIIIADPRLRGEPVNELLELADEFGIGLHRLPEIAQLQDATEARDVQIRPVKVEDLLSRAQAALDRDAMTALVQDKRVLVTGAGGSIGAELVRQVAALGPAEITLLDNSEYNLYEIDRQMAESWPRLPRRALIANVRDADHLDRIFSATRPQLVFHAAALKHVPLLESQASQAVLTNVLGTRNLADTCTRHGVETMVMISSDKAASPANVMGASKRIAEAYCQTLDIEERKRNQGTRFITVRFGNVLGSAGSVIPLFQKQLEAGGPLTVTHPAMTRYFMTIREAVELVLEAATLQEKAMESGGSIVVLDMGKPVSIEKMARQLIRMAGLRPGKDIEIVYTGLRPGEKLEERLFQEDEQLIRTSYNELMIARPRVAERAFVVRIVNDMIDQAGRYDDRRVVELMALIVGDFAGRAERHGASMPSA